MKKSIDEEIFNNAVYRNSYFIIAENAFINNPNYTVYEKMVWLSLATYAGKGRLCFPGQEGIAKNLGVNRESVNRIIKRLERKGGLLIVNQVTESGRKTVNTYILADIDPVTGEFIKESLKPYKSLASEPKRIRGK